MHVVCVHIWGVREIETWGEHGSEARTRTGRTAVQYRYKLEHNSSGSLCAAVCGKLGWAFMTGSISR